MQCTKPKCDVEVGEGEVGVDRVWHGANVDGRRTEYDGVFT